MGENHRVHSNLHCDMSAAVPPDGRIEEGGAQALKHPQFVMHARGADRPHAIGVATGLDFDLIPEPLEKITRNRADLPALRAGRRRKEIKEQRIRKRRGTTASTRQLTWRVPIF
jgi:hypothetical protein